MVRASYPCVNYCVAWSFAIFGRDTFLGIAFALSNVDPQISKPVLPICETGTHAQHSRSLASHALYDSKDFSHNSLKPLYVHLLMGCYLEYSRSPASCDKYLQPGLPFSAVPMDNDQPLRPLTQYHPNAFCEKFFLFFVQFVLTAT